MERLTEEGARVYSRADTRHREPALGRELPRGALAATAGRAADRGHAGAGATRAGTAAGERRRRRGRRRRERRRKKVVDVQLQLQRRRVARVQTLPASSSSACSKRARATTSVARCAACGRLYSSAHRNRLTCPRARTYVDFNGDVIARHVPMRSPGFEIHRHLQRLRARKHTWREIYWHHLGRLTRPRPAVHAVPRARSRERTRALSVSSVEGRRSTLTAGKRRGRGVGFERRAASVLRRRRAEVRRGLGAEGDRVQGEGARAAAAGRERRRRGEERRRRSRSGKPRSGSSASSAGTTPPRGRAVLRTLPGRRRSTPPRRARPARLARGRSGWTTGSFSRAIITRSAAWTSRRK